MTDRSASEQDRLLRGGKVDPEALRKAAEQRLADPDDDDAPNRFLFTLQRDLNKRLDKYLTDRIPFMSRTQLQRLIDDGGVTVNDRKPKASTMLRRGDRVEVFVPPPPAKEIQPEAIPLDVLFEDEHLIVLNKRPDIIVHPARSNLSGTLLNALAHHFREGGTGALSAVGEEFARPGVVHRLDRNTTGCIVFAKQDEAHWKLGRQFEHRTVDKRYIALVQGRMEPEVDVIDLPIGPHPSRAKGYREKYVVRHDELGKPSVTIYRVRARYGPRESPMTLVELELKTGRTHQIRVHLSHLGWPIVGDDMYGGRDVTMSDVGFDPAVHQRRLLEQAGPVLGDLSAVGADGIVMGRQALHAATLGFRHPVSGEPMRFTAPLPRDMMRLIWMLRIVEPQVQYSAPPGATVDLDTLLSDGPGRDAGDARSSI